jgi:anaerobic magnesium-protoporphyrin IX monomethyl ester cyclase
MLSRQAKVLLVVPYNPYRTVLFLQQPIGLLYAATILKQRGYQVSILDLRINGSQSIEETLATQGIPDLAVVTTSTYDLTQCYPWKLDTARQAVAELKKHCPDVFVVGAHGTLNPELTLEELKAKGVLAGEVELVIPQFVGNLHTDASISTKLFRAQGALDVNQLPVPDFGMLPVKEYKSYVPADTNTLHLVPSGLLFANRGCPFTCSYCYTGFFGSAKLRLRSVELVIEEIRSLLEAGIEYLFFLDYTFTVHKKWLNDFLTKMIQANLRVKWGCQTRVNVVDLKTLSMMAEAGCRYIWYGIESPFISSLNQSKPTSKEEIEKAIQWTIEAGIVPMAFLLVGFSGEDIEGMVQWVASQPFIFSVDPLLPRYGTELFDRTNIPITELHTWEELTLAARALQPNQELIESALMKMTQLSNYFANRIAGTPIDNGRDSVVGGG